MRRTARNAFCCGAIGSGIVSCVFYGDYSGGYQLTCPNESESELRRDLRVIAERVADALRVRPKTTMDTQDLLKLDLVVIPFTRRDLPHQSIVFVREKRNGDFGLGVAVNKGGPNPDKISQNSERVVEAAIRSSRCNSWSFDVSHGSLAH